MSESLVPASVALDHLLLGTNDLERGIAWMKHTTGVAAMAGGSHPGRATRNALVALQGRQYVEIIAPDPAQPLANLKLPLLALEQPALFHWAATTDDVDGLATRLRARGLQPLGPTDGARARPDGRIVRWRTLSVELSFHGPIQPIPFFIEWAGDSSHPCDDAPRGCTLVAFELQHPDPEGVRETLRIMGIDAGVRLSQDAQLRATLDTPQGRVVLT